MWPHRRQPTRLPSLGFSRQEHWSGLPFPPPMHESEKWKWSRSVVSDSSWPHGLQPTRLLHPWDFPGKSTGVGWRCLLWICYWKTPNSALISWRSRRLTFRTTQHEAELCADSSTGDLAVMACQNGPRSGALTFWGKKRQKEQINSSSCEGWPPCTQSKSPIICS